MAATYEAALPQLVSIRDLASDHDPNGWGRLDVGVTAEGRPHGITNRYVDSHTLVSGTTASGKTSALRMIAVQALSRGHEVIVMDPIGVANEYATLQPWIKETAAGDREAADLIERVHHEMSRRFDLLCVHKTGCWIDLPEEVRSQQHVRPVTVIIDELVNFQPSEDHAKLRIYAGSIARRGRAAGVHLVVAALDPRPGSIGSELMANLMGNAVLTVAPWERPNELTLRTIFGHNADRAAELVARLHDRGFGFALVGNAFSDSVQAVRIGYTHWNDIPAILEELNVPRATPSFPNYTLLQDGDGS
ncbi:MAG: FtsK/SpoIIIE domain-containing protein [Microbacterium sp.]|uniref:FtsK/SpoIIIE domain-containing protein n=1 Tax=Microbacterium sp. TaxID=51671 RepID=UPI003D6E9D60